MRKRKHSLTTAVIILVLAIISVVKPHIESDIQTVGKVENAALKVHFLDVEQGDCTLIELPNGEKMLIDAGENEMGMNVCDYIRKQGINKIDYVVGTHPHSDHIGGIDTVIKNLGVDKLYLPDIIHDTVTFTEVIDAAQTENVDAKIAKKGVTVVEEEGLKVEFLSPVSESYEELNNYSAVVSLEFNGVSFLFMGDAEHVVEKEISKDIFEHDVIKVGHHGSNTSSTANFLKKVEPKYAVISVGEGNQYNHPHEVVLKRYGRMNAKIFRTDEQGTIVALSDGKNIEFKTER